MDHCASYTQITERCPKAGKGSHNLVDTKIRRREQTRQGRYREKAERVSYESKSKVDRCSPRGALNKRSQWDVYKVPELFRCRWRAVYLRWQVKAELLSEAPSD